MKREDILQTLSRLKPKYAKEGVVIVGLFGSIASDTADEKSDIDIAYRIEYDTFSHRYKDGFSKLLRLEEIKEELEKHFHARVDFVPDSNASLLKGMIRV